MNLLFQIDTYHLYFGVIQYIVAYCLYVGIVRGDTVFPCDLFHILAEHLLIRFADLSKLEDVLCNGLLGQCALGKMKIVYQKITL